MKRVKQINNTNLIIYEYSIPEICTRSDAELWIWNLLNNSRFEVLSLSFDDFSERMEDGNKTCQVVPPVSQEQLKDKIIDVDPEYVSLFCRFDSLFLSIAINMYTFVVRFVVDLKDENIIANLESVFQ